MREQHRRLISPFATDTLQADQDLRSYKPTIRSIGHLILDEDRRAERVPIEAYLRLDGVIARAAREIDAKEIDTVEQAIAVLTGVERVVTESNCVCSIPYFLVHSFAQGLVPRELDKRLIYAEENAQRLAYIQAHLDETFSMLDCDLGSILYLSVADALGITLSMVEVPQHNFVRWRLSDTSYVNWDTNFGFNKFSNSDYATKYGVSDVQIERGTYLSDLTTANVQGYFCFVRGLSFERVTSYPNAVQEYRQAHSLYPQSPSPLNNCAWLFVTQPAVRKLVSCEQAIAFSEKACDLDRSHTNLDTLACVQAECGNFDNAIRFEEEAYSKNPQPSYLQMIEAFKNSKTWLDVHGK